MTVGIETAVVDKLEAITAVTNITDRIRVDHLQPNDDYPAVVVTKTSEEPIDDLQGLGGCFWTTVEVACYAENEPDSKNLEWATRFGVTTQTGTAAGLADFAGTVGGLVITDITWEGTTTSIDDPDDGKAAPLYIATGTYRVENQSPS